MIFVYKIKNFIETLEKTKINGKLSIFTDRFSSINLLSLPEFIDSRQLKSETQQNFFIKFNKPILKFI